MAGDIVSIESLEFEQGFLYSERQKFTDPELEHG